MCSFPLCVKKLFVRLVRCRIVPILLQTSHGFRVLGFISQQEQIKYLLGLLAGIRLPDLMQGLPALD